MSFGLKARAYSEPRTVLFVVFDPNGINPKKANPLLKKFYQALKDFRYDKDQIRSSVAIVGDFYVEQKNPNLLLGSYLIRMEIFDKNDDGQAPYRFNNCLGGWIGKAISNIVFVHYNTVIKVVESHFELGDLSATNQRSYVSGLNPKEEQAKV